MRKTSKILGVVGGSLTALVAILIIIGGVFITSFIAPLVNDYMDSEYYENLIEAEGLDSYGLDEYVYKEGVFDISTLSGAAVITIGIVFLIIAVLGIVGGAVVEKSNTLGSVFMFTSGVIMLITVIGTIGGILMIFGGIFALVKEKEKITDVQVETVG